MRQHRDRAAQSASQYDFLKREAGTRLIERLDDIARSFPTALELGAHHGIARDALTHRDDIETLVQCDLSHSLLKRATGLRCVCDEEWLPFAPNRFDLVFSVLSLHWVNDLPGSLIQIRHILKDDGLFLAVVPGANTLKELRESILLAAAKGSDGMAPSLSPLLEVRDAGGLLQRAGFALPVIDSDTVTVTYDHAFKLFADLRGMGETNALIAQHRYIPKRDWWMRVAAMYQERFGNPDGTIPATFEWITLTGWKPHASQQQPAKRGSGKVSLGEVFGKDDRIGG